jgi:IBR domain, a half RING-finger domain
MAEICEICCREKTALEENNQIYVLKCGHPYCKMCLSKYVISQLTENGSINIPCPTSLCGNKITDDDIQAFMLPSLMQGYISQKNYIIVSNDPNKKICPAVNCGKFAIKGANCWECVCGYKFCFICNGKFDPVNHSCKTVMENLRKDLGNNTKVRSVIKCVKCKMYFTKDHGCNHMTCPYCKYEWCFLCGSVYTPTHYTGMFACASHFKNFPFHIFLLLNILALLLFPLSFLVLSIFFCIYGIAWLHKKCVRRKHLCARVWFLVGAVFGAFITIAVGYPILMAPVFIIQIIRIIVFSKRYANKRKMYV